MKGAYYNEFDKNAAEWIRQLIKMGLVAEGDVDERSIMEVKADEIRGYTQCHFFAGVAVWSYALRQAGWPDDRPVWTGSCPCQPFSTAGKGKGFADERHLWPVFFNLIRECRPVVALGEQVGGKNGEIWLDALCDDLESENYAAGAVVTAACGFGAPHQRKRLYWCGINLLADASGERKHGGAGVSGSTRGAGRESVQESDGGGDSGELAHSPRLGRADGQALAGGEGTLGGEGGRGERTGDQGHAGELADSRSAARERDAGDVRGAQAAGRGEGLQDGDGRVGYPDGCDAGELADAADQRHGIERDGAAGWGEPVGNGGDCQRPGPVNGFWRAADWLFCRDGKWRPAQRGFKPLAHGSPSELVCSGDLGISDVEATKEARVMRLKGYGNAVVAQQAQAFIEAVMEETT